MTIPEPVTRLRDALQKLYGPRLQAVVLYGSYARDSQTQNSDVDVAIVLKGEVAPTREIDRMAEIVTDLNLEYSTLLSVYPVSTEDYQKRQSPLLINLRREGVAA
jgi:predicted nucleotidyltransferase